MSLLPMIKSIRNIGYMVAFHVAFTIIGAIAIASAMIWCLYNIIFKNK